MRDEAEESVDKNSRGLGVALRAAGALLPLVVFWTLFLNIYRGWPTSDGVPRALSRVLTAIAYLWAWPYGLYHEAPLAFAALGLIGVLFAVLLWVRRDRRGAVTVLVWCLFWGWLLAAIIGDVRGT